MSKKYIADIIEIGTSATIAGNNILTTTSGYATTNYVDNAVAGVVNSAPTTLDTLNELAAALGNDPNFATTVTNSIGLKWTQDNAKIANWDTAYSYSQVGHLPLTGGTVSGGLGIGANVSADSKLTVYNGTGNAYIQSYTPSGVAYFGSISSGDASLESNNAIRFTTGASYTERMRIDSSGNVSLSGTTFVNSSRTNLYLNSFASGGGNGIFFRDGFTYNCSITAEDHNGNAADGICISGYDGVSFSTGSNSKNERMRIDSSGNVGIGTTSPTDKLDVRGSFRVNHNDTYSQGMKNELISTYISQTQFGRIGTPSTLDIYYDIYGTEQAVIRRNYANADLLFKLGSSTHMTIYRNGNLGIGTTSPSAKLDISGILQLGEGSSTPSGAGVAYGLFHYSGVGLGLYSAASGSTQGIGFWLNNGAAYEAGRWLSNGNLGIGTTSPSYKLQVSNGTNTYSVNPTSGGIDLHSSGNISTHYQNDYYVFSGNLGSGTPRMHIDSNGNMQVLRAGNTNKGTLLLGQSGSGTNKWSVLAASHYNQDTGSGNGVGSAGVMMIGCYSSLTENVVYIGGNPWEVNPATAIAFNTHTSTVDTAGGTERMRIDSSGNVGIGTTSPSQKLHVAGVIRTDNCLNINNHDVYFGNSNGLLYSTGDTVAVVRGSGGVKLAVGAYEKVTLDSSGNLGIGTTSPSAKLEVAGDFKYAYPHIERVYYDSFANTPGNRTYKMSLASLTGSGQSAFYYFTILGYRAFGNMNSHFEYKVHIHRRRAGTSDLINAQVYKMSSEVDGLQFFIYNEGSGSNGLYNMYVYMPSSYSGIFVYDTPQNDALNNTTKNLWSIYGSDLGVPTFGSEVIAKKLIWT